MKIKLEWYETLACAVTGIVRRVESKRRGMKDAYGFDRSDKWTIDIEGACGELAAAKALGRYWDHGGNTFHAGDVGRLQVRTARSKTPYLLVRPNNRKEDVFVLVHGEAPNFDVIGWMRGKDAMKKKYIKRFGGRPAVFAVPPKDLHPLEELP